MADSYIPHLILKYQGKNEYFINGDTAEMVLYGKDGFERGRITIDSEDVKRCSKLRWCYYTGGYIGSYKHIIGGKSDTFTSLSNFLLNFNSSRKIHIDHKNRDNSDNRKVNLRVCTRQQNLMNNSQEAGETGFRGVYPSADNSRFRARIKHDGVLHKIGSFGTAIEAAKAWNERALTLRGEFAVLNPV